MPEGTGNRTSPFYSVDFDPLNQKIVGTDKEQLDEVATDALAISLDADFLRNFCGPVTSKFTNDDQPDKDANGVQDNVQDSTEEVKVLCFND